jgi:LacI family transcriptional regulator
LTELGHRRIAYLHTVRDDKFSRPTLARRDAFYRLAVELDLEVQPGWVPYVGYNADTIRTTLHEILQRDVRPTALIIYDVMVSPVYAELHANGLTPGKDISVIGTNDMPGDENLLPPLTSQRIPRSRLARMALQAIKRIREGETIGVEYVETGIVMRESTSRVNK